MNDVDKADIMPLLTHEQIEKVADWINGKALDPADPCPVCGGESEVTPFRVKLPVGANHQALHGLLQTVVTVCMNCAYVRLFASDPIGVSEPGDEVKITPDDLRSQNGQP